MSRSGYNDEVDDQLQFGRWRAMVASATRGKRGQAMFKELLAALDAMPNKRLIAHDLEKEGEVCTLGALAKANQIPVAGVDPEEPEQVAKLFDIAPCLAQEIEYMNDENWPFEDFRSDTNEPMTPETRWERMRDWVAKQIKT